MKVFLSWSGDHSHKVALAFRDWLPLINEKIKPFVSTDDIDKGSRWLIKLSKELEETSIGIICLTKNNINAPWITFEAGALSKYIENSRVIPFLFRLDVSDVKGPLSHFQSTLYKKDDIKRLLISVNNSLEESEQQDETLLIKRIDACYKELEEKLDGIEQLQPHMPVLEKIRDRIVANHDNDFIPHTWYGLKQDDIYDSNYGNIPKCDDMFVSMIYHLWSDPRDARNKISAYIKHLSSEEELCICKDEFENAYCQIDFSYYRGYPPNIVFRPGGSYALFVNDPENSMLKFDACIINNNDESNEINIQIRITDAMGTSWINGYRSGWAVIHTLTGKWHDISIKLDNGNWRLFSATGNTIYKNPIPDFSILSCVAVEIGTGNESDRLRAPKNGMSGTIGIKNFRIEPTI